MVEQELCAKMTTNIWGGVWDIFAIELLLSRWLSNFRQYLIAWFMSNTSHLFLTRKKYNDIM